MLLTRFSLLSLTLGCLKPDEHNYLDFSICFDNFSLSKIFSEKLPLINFNREIKVSMLKTFWLVKN